MSACRTGRSPTSSCSEGQRGARWPPLCATPAGASSGPCRASLSLSRLWDPRVGWVEAGGVTACRPFGGCQLGRLSAGGQFCGYGHPAGVHTGQRPGRPRAGAHLPLRRPPPTRCKDKNYDPQLPTHGHFHSSEAPVPRSMDKLSPLHPAPTPAPRGHQQNQMVAVPGH